jgi:hypothetical protein
MSVNFKDCIHSAGNKIEERLSYEIESGLHALINYKDTKINIVFAGV